MRSLGGRRRKLLFAVPGLALLPILAGSARAASEEDVLLRALKDELYRSVEKLKVENLEKPYYIAYALVDGQFLEIEAAFGALVKTQRFPRGRWLKTEVRVGSHALDNSEFLGSRSFFFGGGFPRPLVLEDDYDALRHDLWLATDEVYKGALEQYAQKRAALQNRVEPEPIPDFSEERPNESVSPRRRVQYDPAKWQGIVRRLSGLFRGFPGIQDSSVKLRVILGDKYFLSSEGGLIRQPSGVVLLSARASTQAADGMRLRHFVPFYGKSLEDLPSEAEMSAAIRRMAEELTALATAPTLENYSGPALLTGQAAAELFAQLLAPQLSGHRPPVFERQEMAARIPRSELADRLNRPVLPRFLSVVDDPTQTELGGQPLIGAYAFDDQGIAARPVTLIQEGVLKTLLMSRRPHKEIPQSNGHGRALAQGSAAAVIGNLFVRAADGKTFAELKEELIRLCREQGLKYGLLIKMLEQPALTEGGLPFFPFRMGGRPPGESLSAPILAYTVSVDGGREELVRGLTAGEIPIRTLKDILAAGSESYVNNRTAGGEEFGTTGIAATVIAPSLLFEELEFKRASGSQQKPVLLPHPSFTR